MVIKHGWLYLADLSPAFGSEAGKTRPVLVIQTRLLNEAEHPSTWIIPCTTRLTGDSILRVSLPKKTAGNTQPCEVMIDQSRTIDNRRLLQPLGPLPPPLLRECKEKLSLLAEMDSPSRASR